MNSSRPVSLGGYARLLFTHNPFYLISALLVLYGIYRALPAGANVGGGWMMFGLLSGYTLALALAGYVVIRFGQVWDDARTILLTLMLLFVSLSAVFDQIVLENPSAGARLLTMGLLFVALVSEGVLRSLKLRLAFRYRGPYYLILTLLFCYPMILGQLSKASQGETMPLFVLLFPIASGLAFLTLLPAARGGDRRDPSRGIPWSWPGYPWSIFVVLLIATALRSYSFSGGFESGHFGQSSFAPYFLLPLLFSAAFLFLELAISAKNSGVCTAALVAPLGLLLLALPGKCLNPVAADFLERFSQAVGSPIQLTAAGLAIFYAIAWIRGFRLAEVGLIGCMSILAFVDRGTVGFDTFCSPHWLPLASIALLEFAVGLWSRASWREMLAAAFGMATISCLDWNGSLPPQVSLPPWSLAGLLVLSLGALRDDRWARRFRRIAWPLIPLVGGIVACDLAIDYPEVARWAEAIYLACLTGLALTYWYRSPSLPVFAGAMVSLSILAGTVANWAYLDLENSLLAEGLPWLAWGSGAFALALLLSFAKGGSIADLIRWLRSFGHGSEPAAPANASSPSP